MNQVNYWVMRVIILLDKAFIISFVSCSELIKKKRNNLNTAFTEPQTETNWILLTELWNSIHIIYYIKVFNLLNKSIRDLIRQHYRQIEEIINCNKHNPFRDINLYKLFNSAVILISVNILINLSLTAFLVEIAQGMAKIFSDYYIEDTIISKHKKINKEKEKDNK